MPKAKPKDVQLQIRMPLAMHDALRLKAAKERRTLAGAARLILEKALKLAPEPRP